MPKFQLLTGTHIIGKDPKTAKVYEAIPGKNVIETETDLVKNFGRRRFRRLSDEDATEMEQKAKEEHDEFESLTDEELLGLANRHGIDIRKAKTREKLLQAIRGALATA